MGLMLRVQLWAGITGMPVCIWDVDKMPFCISVQAFLMDISMGCFCGIALIYSSVYPGVPVYFCIYCTRRSQRETMTVFWLL